MESIKELMATQEGREKYLEMIKTKEGVDMLLGRTKEHVGAAKRSKK